MESKCPEAHLTHHRVVLGSKAISVYKVAIKLEAYTCGMKIFKCTHLMPQYGKGPDCVFLLRPGPWFFSHPKVVIIEVNSISTVRPRHPGHMLTTKMMDTGIGNSFMDRTYTVTTMKETGRLELRKLKLLQILRHC